MRLQYPTDSLSIVFQAQIYVIYTVVQNISVSHLGECVCEIVQQTQPLQRIFRPHRPPDWRPSSAATSQMYCMRHIWHDLFLNPPYFTRIVPYFTLLLPASVKFHQNFAAFCLLLHNLQIADSLDSQDLRLWEGFCKIFFSSSLKKFRIKYKDDYFWLYLCWGEIEYWTCEYIVRTLS